MIDDGSSGDSAVVFYCLLYYVLQVSGMSTKKKLSHRHDSLLHLDCHQQQHVQAYNLQRCYEQVQQEHHYYVQSVFSISHYQHQLELPQTAHSEVAYKIHHLQKIMLMLLLDILQDHHSDIIMAVTMANHPLHMRGIVGIIMAPLLREREAMQPIDLPNHNIY
jgi:hypothetical protein